MAKLNDLIVTGDTKMLGKLHANADTATTASSIFDSGNKSLITLNYSASGISNPAWLAGWNGYELRSVSRTALTVGYASLLALNSTLTTTNTRSVGVSSWNGGISSGLNYMWGQSFKDTSIGSDTGDIVLAVRAGQYTSGGTELCVMIDGDYYSMGNKVLHAGNYTSYALPRSGSVGMTGVLHLKAEQYTDSITAGALNANNSNIYGVNSIYTADLADSASEGIHFYRTSTTVDSLWGKNGVLYFSPNRTVGSGSSTDYTILHTGNYKTYALARDGSNAMTGALQFANSTGTWAATANYANSLILFGERTHDEVTSRHYFPWMGGYDGVNSKGYLGTITMGLFHGAPADAGLFIGASWDKANADTFFYFTRSGTFETPRVAVGGYNNTTYALSTSSFICNSWVRTVGDAGWYSENYGCHVRPNTVGSYGSIRIHGGARNGYEGIHFGSGTSGMTVMSIDGSHQGLYQQSNGTWIIYHNGGGSVGINTSSLVSGFNVTLGGATYINGKVVVKGTGNSYNEGIRILPASNGWSNVFFSADDTTQGTHNGGWLIGRRGAAGSIAGGIGDFTIEEEDSTGANLTIYKNGGGAHLRGGFSLSGLITATSGASHAGVKIGDVYINAIGGNLILQNLGALRFGGDSWDYNIWAGLKYNHSNKYIYLGLADGTVFTTNSAQSGGRILTPGISYLHVGNQTTYYMTDGGRINSSVITFPSTAATLSASTPMSITYGKIAAYGTLTINANTDNSGTEYVLLTAGKGLSNTLTDGLAIGTSTLQWQGSDVTTHTTKIVDASGQNTSTYYPVVIDIPYTGLRRIKLAVQLDSGTVPSWSTHSSGFTTNIDIEIIAAGWGTVSPYRYIKYQDDYNFASVKPAYFVGQLTNNSKAVFYVRGGGKYRFVCNWQSAGVSLRTAETDYSGQKVAPTTGTPTWLAGTKTKVETNIEGSATTLRDKTNGTETYLNYGASGITNPTWYAAWNGYELRGISALEVRKGISALGAVSDGSYYGIAAPDGTDDVWIRTTSQGIIPYQSGSRGSGHQSLGTSTWYFSNAYIDSVNSNTTYAYNWFRSYNQTGWFNETYGGGIYMIDTTYVRTYNDKAFYVSNSGQHAIYTAGGFASSNSNGSILSTYYNSTWYSSIKTHGNGNLSISPPGGSLYIAYDCGNTYFGGGTYYIDRAGYFNGKADKANKDGDGNTISSTYLKLSGGTMTGSIAYGHESASKRILYGTLRNSGMKYDYAGNEALIISSGTYSNSSIHFYTSNRLSMSDSSGQWNATTPCLSIKNTCVGINAVPNESYKLYVNGASYFSGAVTVSGQVSASSFNATSDMRLKINLRTFEHGNIFDLPVYKFDFIVGETDKIGCMAQDLQKICPEIVHQREDGYLTIEESKIVYLLLDKMKEMQKEINVLKEGK